ncbi:MAG: dTDP-4-dehydrorhamnose 3,5-epimerase [Calditrichaeota bacterium]|nr:MAG: dTDP-4-dehydrorhamnose 3,5-epimerase [Calditrichota bacterium]MBL1203964.1 dTDP-4-dehydrorhamnose 3,5-epimerase [Calditrichota bacterium]NOG43795.1 dTDP-4-dehydrorhamnose 3,5-epimerase [Calditrichota bacterium]
MPFIFEKTEIEEVLLVKPKIYNDQRGHFFESYKKSEFIENGIQEEFVQDNCSKSVKGVLRGLHYQVAPFVQGKFVRCINGAVFDVAVDIRRNSATFGKWVGYELSEENNNMLYIPPGFAHGFQALTDIAEVAYKVTAEYSYESERGIMWNDPEINIKWPIKDVLLSEKDTGFPGLNQADLLGD